MFSDGGNHAKYRTVMFLLIFFFMRSKICCGSYIRLHEIVKGRCLSKSNTKNDERNCVGRLSCPRVFGKDTACWEKTCAGETATATCPMLFFRTNVTAEAFCEKDGTWNFSRADWKKKCTKLSAKEMQILLDTLLSPEDSNTQRHQTVVYVTFSWISLSFMIPSLVILFYFMDSKNVRFNLHKNLICAFLFRSVTFFIDYYGSLDRTSSNVFWVLNRFFALSEVSWMLNEAALLLKLLFRTFDAKSYFWAFFAFGWGFPAILVVAIYVPIMVNFVDKENKLFWKKGKDSFYMFTLYGPMTLMLLINFATLIYVIYVLLGKLRTSTTSELLRLKKGIKAALILMPLLGVIYLMILYVPGNAPVWYTYLIRILYPVQGTLACLVYVVFNGEVRQVMRAKWHRWLHTKSEFLERRREVANFLNGAEVLEQQLHNGGDAKHTTVVKSNSRGFISIHLEKELTYNKARHKLKQNVSPTTPLSSDGGDQEKPLFPTENHTR